MGRFMVQVFDLLWTHTWWTYQPHQGWDVYHYFNLFEGICWCLLGGLVAVRYLKNRRSNLEIAYGLAFVAFGATDFREAYVLQSGLVVLKAINVVALFLLRRVVMSRYYPAAKLF